MPRPAHEIARELLEALDSGAGVAAASAGLRTALKLFLAEQPAPVATTDLGDASPCTEELLETANNSNSVAVEGEGSRLMSAARVVLERAVDQAPAGARDDVRREVSAMPFFRTDPTDALETACALGMQHSVAALLSSKDVERSLRSGPATARARARVLQNACSSGNESVVASLLGPPLFLGRDEYLSDACLALRNACSSGSVGAVDELAWVAEQVDRSTAAACDEAFKLAASRGFAGVLRRLLLPPFSVSLRNAETYATALEAAIIQCSRDAVELLVSDAIAMQENVRPCVQNALRMACSSGRAEVVRFVAGPPLMADSEDARLCGALSAAIESGSAEVISALAEPPFEMQRREALESVGAVVSLVASGERAIKAIEVLRCAPFALRPSDLGVGGEDIAQLGEGALAELRARSHAHAMQADGAGLRLSFFPFF
eukprot:m51a1_g3718 hypothetical protein (434) ;mRNA; f:460144-461787